MKKLLALILVICSLSSVCVYAEGGVEEKIETLKKYHIVSCYEDGNFYPEKNITRAEFCKLVSAMLGENDPKPTVNSYYFKDVPKEFWANPYITYCRNLGLVNGVYETEKLYAVVVDENGNETGKEELFLRDDFNELHGTNAGTPPNLFAPNDFITRRDALKIIVNALGYEPMAIKEGGYPNGYIAAAERIGIIKSRYGDTTEYLTREGAAEIIYDALSVPLMTENKTENSVEYIIMDGSDGVELKTLYKTYFEKYDK